MTKRWVVDTSHYTHLSRAGHASLMSELAPGGVIIVPTYVDTEIEAGRDLHDGIPSVSSVPWAEIAVLSDAEDLAMLRVKANMGGSRDQHLGECAVIACAAARGGLAILDDRAAIAQADLFGVPTVDTLWVVVEAYRTVFDRDRARAARVVDDLLATGMMLPVDSGDEFVAWAYVNGLLP